MLFPFLFRHFELGNSPALNGNPGVVNRLRCAGYQRVPIVKWLALVQETIRAGARHPIGNLVNIAWLQYHAIGDELLPNVVLCAPTGLSVQQSAGHPRKRNFLRVRVFQLIQATPTAPVTQRLPFPGVHVLEGDALPVPITKTVAIDGILVAQSSPASISRARAESASICAINASRLSNFSSGRRYSTKATDISAP